jgi:hypothetical protein
MKKKFVTSAATLVVAVAFVLASSIPASASTWSLGGRNCTDPSGDAHSGISSVTKGNVTHTEAANAFVAQHTSWSGDSTWRSRASVSSYGVTSANYVDASAKYVASTSCVVNI